MKKIQLDGVWYNLVPISKIEEEEIVLSFTHCCMVENDKYVFEAIRLGREESMNEFYDGIDIKFTDKRQKPWSEDIWDGNLWFNNIVDGDQDAIDQALGEMCQEGLATFTSFLKKLREIGWLVK